MDWTTIISLAGAALSGGIGTWLLSLYKERGSQSLSKDEQTFNILVARIKDLETHFTEVEVNYIAAREENVRLKTLLDMKNEEGKSKN